MAGVDAAGLGGPGRSHIQADCSELWIRKPDTSHDPDLARRLFRRSAHCSKRDYPESGALPLGHAPPRELNPCSRPAGAASSAIQFAGESGAHPRHESGAPPHERSEVRCPPREARELYPLQAALALPSDYQLVR